MNAHDLVLKGGPASRRFLLGGLAAGAFAVRGALAEVEAGKKKNKKRKKDKKKPIADARCPGPPEVAAFGSTSNRQFGQTFTARASGKLVRAQVMVNAHETEDANWLVQIVDVGLQGQPTETVLATATIANPSLPAGPVTLTANFSPPATVTINREYALVIGWSGEENFSFPCHDTNPCGGRLYSKEMDLPGEYTPTTPRDLIYTTFVKK